ncbi:MAG: hypothetical protein ACXAD7_14340 [Candidatus Kariarchaeaceae archaeon]
MRELDKYKKNKCRFCDHLDEVHELLGYHRLVCIICDCGDDFSRDVKKKGLIA